MAATRLILQNLTTHPRLDSPTRPRLFAHSGKQYLTDNLAGYLFGTEFPDNSNKSIGGIGDTTKHQVYYSASGTLIENASAQRANDEYILAPNFLEAKDYVNAAKTAGTMTHYIADIAVFGHVKVHRRLGGRSSP